MGEGLSDVSKRAVEEAGFLVVWQVGGVSRSPAGGWVFALAGAVPRVK